MHWFEGQWALSDEPSGIYTLCINPTIFDYIKIYKLKPTTICFSKISHKRIVDVTSNRYQYANTRYPMIVTPMYNPEDLEFRMIDGCHRIYKLKEAGKTQGWFYIIPKDIVLSNINKVHISVDVYN
jgi:hypothetical protein